MTHRTQIKHARLPDRPGLHTLIIDESTTIQAIVPEAGSAPQFIGDRPDSTLPDSTLPDTILDVQGDWISPGGVDLQINGALGLAFPDLQDHHGDTLVDICQFLWKNGIDGFLPTLVTSSINTIHQALSVVAAVQQQQSKATYTATILGVHLEGPCLNVEKRGAHSQAHLQPLTLDTVMMILGGHAPIVRMMTLAPELDPTGEVIPYLRSLGIVVSLGHSHATEEQAKTAFDQGATLVTHAFNAMPPLHHRTPGLLGAALTHPSVACGVIADGQHVCPTMLDVLLRVGRGSIPTAEFPAYPHGLFLVSDALAPLGLPDGTYPWDTRQIHVQQGTARLDDGTLAGTTHPLLVGAQNLVRWGICEPGEAIALATLAPRRAIGLPGLEPGQPAHLLRWSWDGEGRSLIWKRLMD